MKTIAFFNNKGGVGKTVLVYHLSYMLTQMGHVVVAADLDPQANLSSMFLEDGDLESLWGNEENREGTVYSATQPLADGTGDVTLRGWEKEIKENLFLLTGDLRLSNYEDSLSETWSKLFGGEERKRAFRVQCAFHRFIQAVGEERSANFALVDIGPNLGAINRAALIACDYVITPLSPDLFSWRGLVNFGGKLKEWREIWKEVPKKKPDGLGFDLPEGEMNPLGYITMRYNIRKNRPTGSYEKWIKRMPKAFRTLMEEQSKGDISVEEDPFHLATLKDYFSLMAMAQEARKPMFELTPADGVVGGHIEAVSRCREDFESLARKIIDRIESRDD